nr:ATP synthase F0 subunit B [Deltaproteobacteria bacterium]
MNPAPTNRLGFAARVGIAVSVALWPMAVLASPAAEEAAHGGEHAGGHIEWITPVFGHTGNLGLVWAFVNFAVLFWILNKILFAPLRKRTAAKHDTVKSEIQKATDAREQSESVLAEYRGRLDALDDEIAELLADAKAKAESDRKRIIADAEREAEQIRASAVSAAEREAAARKRQLEAEIVDRAIARAETVLRDKMTPADHGTMVDRYV